MKKKILLLGTFITVYLSSFAALTKGDAVITKCGRVANDIVVQVYDVANTITAPGPAPLGDDWNLAPDGMAQGINNANWTAENLGQVFGIAINTSNQANPLIYVSTTQIYPQQNIAYLTGYE